MSRGDRVRVLTGMLGGHLGVVTHTHASWSTGRLVVDVLVECDDPAHTRAPLPYDVDELAAVPLGS